MPFHTVVLRKKNVLFLLLFIMILLLVFRTAAVRYEERHIAALSWVLADKLIVIDPGHGGEDPGALGHAGIHEKEIVLEVSKKLADTLRQSGAQVLLTRESDQSQYKTKVQDLNRRVELANENNADLFVSIHVNSFPDRREKGAQTFSQPGSEEGKKLATDIQNELNRFLENPGRAPKQVDYFANRMTKMPSVIIEIGFISNPQEEKLMLDPVYQNKIAWSIHAGIARYFAQAAEAAGDKKS